MHILCASGHQRLLHETDDSDGRAMTLPRTLLDFGYLNPQVSCVACSVLAWMQWPSLLRALALLCKELQAGSSL